MKTKEFNDVLLKVIFVILLFSFAFSVSDYKWPIGAVTGMGEITGEVVKVTGMADADPEPAPLILESGKTFEGDGGTIIITNIETDIIKYTLVGTDGTAEPLSGDIDDIRLELSNIKGMDASYSFALESAEITTGQKIINYYYELATNQINNNFPDINNDLNQDTLKIGTEKYTFNVDPYSINDIYWTNSEGEIFDKNSMEELYKKQKIADKAWEIFSSKQGENLGSIEPSRNYIFSGGDASAPSSPAITPKSRTSVPIQRIETKSPFDLKILPINAEAFKEYKKLTGDVYIDKEGNAVEKISNAQIVKLGKYDADTGLIKLKVKSNDKERFYDPNSGIYYLDDKKEKEGGKLYPKTKAYTEYAGNDDETEILYSGEYLIGEVGETVYLDGRGGWYETQESDGDNVVMHFDGTGNVNWDSGFFLSPYKNFAKDTDKDGVPDGDIITYKSCTGQYCEKDNGGIVDCKEADCYDAKAKVISKDSEEYKKIFGFMGYNGYWFGTLLKDMQDATSGYSGVSFFYDEPDPIIELDETMANLLGGIDGWTSEICKEDVSDSLDKGIAFSPYASDGAYAHIEGAKITLEQYNTSTPTTSYLYKISFVVKSGSDERGCDLDFSVHIGSKALFTNSDGSAYIFKTRRGEGENTVSYSGSSMIAAQSQNNYDQLCIRFKDITPPIITERGGTQKQCLVGVEEGDDVCVSIYGEGGRKMSLENPCDDLSFSLFMPGCWSNPTEDQKWTQGSGAGGTQTPGATGGSGPNLNI